MSGTKIQIEHVSDTSLWVAWYRAEESERTNALFNDPFAKKLVGERGKKIAENMKAMGPYSAWTVIMRTLIIDRFIEKLIDEKIDTVINFGAGLDTRPYRMKLPSTLNWIEVDFPNIINHKNSILQNDSPVCNLTRVSLDLSDSIQRENFLNEVQTKSKNVVILTEGVVPYLSEREMDELAKTLFTKDFIQYWIAEYISPKIYPHLKSRVRKEKMKNAPFKFFPSSWFDFFKQRGWVAKKIEYLGEIASEHNRAIPMPKWAPILFFFIPIKIKQKFKQMSGFVLFEKIKN